MEFVKTTLVPYVTHGKFDKCVCLGLGSLESRNAHHTQSHYQLAFLEGLMEAFGWRGSCKPFTLIQVMMREEREGGRGGVS